MADAAVTIVIPAYNEAEHLGEVLDDLLPQLNGQIAEVVVVDDGSADETAAEAEARAVTLIRHPVNRGYGASLKTGIRHATTPFVVTMDSDGQHRVEDVLAVCAAAQDFDLVVGQRTELIHSTIWRMPGKWFLTWVASYLSRTTIPDLNSGLRVFRREEVLKYLRLCPDGFSFSTTSTMAFLCRGHRVHWLPIQVRARQGGTSMVKLRTGMDTLVLILRLATLFNPLRIFLPAAIWCWVISILWGLPYLLMGRGVSTGASLAVMLGVLLLALGLLSDQISQLRLERYE